VEQRVKVMDTLDKKMESILEREDLSTDERLKLYDQSLTRYLKSNGATTEAIGASRDPKNPPFCKIAFFFLRETDIFVSALNPALFLASFI
jgi:hypothetical protein